MNPESKTSVSNLEQNVQGSLAVENITHKNDILRELHNNNSDEKILAPSEVQSSLLCSNNFVTDCTSLGGKNLDEIENKMAKQLSEIIFNLWQKQLKLNTMDLPIQE